MKKTPLYNRHAELGAKIIDFGGWAMPVQYTGIIAEHECVRENAGLFDVSHMGEIYISGKDAEKFIQKVVTNDISKMEPGRIVYSPVCYPSGGVVDDIIIYKLSDNYYLLVVNAVNTQKDFEWIIQNKEGQVSIENVSSSYAQLAFQGPKAQSVLQKMTDTDLNSIKFFRFLPHVKLGGIDALVSRTGYTGEDGFEIYLSPEYVGRIWDMIFEAGKDEGVAPIGLGARDTLRFEAALPLYGQEISQDISPLEAGLGKFVKLDKEDFIGKQALVIQKTNGIARKLVGFEMVDRGIPRSHFSVNVDGEQIGFVTTGGFSPTLKKNIGMAIIDTNYTKGDNEIGIQVRNRYLKAKIIKLPFYQKHYKKG